MGSRDKEMGQEEAGWQRQELAEEKISKQEWDEGIVKGQEEAGWQRQELAEEKISK
jgi:hypothetical protein